MTIEQNSNSQILEDLLAYSYFSHVVKTQRRYIHSEWTNEFLRCVRETSKDRQEFFSKDREFWRARLGSKKAEGVKCYGVTPHQKDIPYPPEEMKPLSDRTKEGRANPKGIPCLYLATNMQTAMQEVRPWLGTLMSVAKFRVARDLKLVDCSKNIHKLDGTGSDSLGPRLYETEILNAPEFKECTWSYIDRAFSIPVDPSDDKADYVPTQILAELFISAGYDGIIYNSMLSEEGKNVALFNLNLAEQITDTKLYKITNIPSFDFSEV